MWQLSQKGALQGKFIFNHVKTKKNIFGVSDETLEAPE